MTEDGKGVPVTGVAGRHRFYKAVAVVPFPFVGEGPGGRIGKTSDSGVLPTPNPLHQRGGEAFRILLDSKPIRTPAKKDFVLPTRALADAVAQEWEAQRERVDPTTMPMTRIVNSALDGVAGREREVEADIVKYAGTDLLCYRADSPPELVRRQAEAWDPILAWARDVLGVSLHVVVGVMPKAQPAEAAAGVSRAIEGCGAFELAALHVMTTLMGSVLLALAHARGRLSASQAWAAAHVDEDWQISQWGEDADAKARRERRWQDMQAASRLLGLARANS